MEAGVDRDSQHSLLEEATTLHIVVSRSLLTLCIASLSHEQSPSLPKEMPSNE